MIYKKYYLYKEQVSLDGGVTYQDVVPLVTAPSGDPIAEYSTYDECTGGTPEIQYRWTQSGTTCIGYDKYQNNIKEQSTDGGSTWTVVIPEEYSASTLIETDSPDCGYVPPTPTGCTCDAFAFQGTNEGNNTYRIEIPSSETAVTAATWNTSCGLVPQDFTHTDDSGFQEIVTDGHWSFDNNLIKFTASTNSTNYVREGNMTITYTVDGNSCTKVTHLVQSPSTNFGGRYKLILNNNSVVTGACNSTSSVTSGDVASQYSGTVVSAIIGDCAKEIGYAAFIDCDGLTSVTIGNNVTTINENAFFFCDHLTNIVIPNSVTTIGVSAFYDDEKLSGVTIGTGVTSIGMYAFQGCWELASITIPNNVTTINMYAFHNCKGLNNIIIGNGITSMGEGIFYNDTGLTSVTILATTPPTLGNNAFYNTSSNLVIYVPAASLTDYQTAWSSYASRIQAIP